MTEKQYKTVKVISLAVFSMAVLLFFRFNSLIRPAPCGALYKEWMAGSIVLAVSFLNYFVLIPRMLSTRRFLLYIIIIVASAVFSAAAELMLVFPQISFTISGFEISLKHYFFALVEFLFLRNLCFLFFFFIICIFEQEYKENKEIHLFLRKKKHLIAAKDRKHNIHTLPIDKIVYCQQKENYSFFYLDDGKVYSKNCTMGSLSEDFGTNCAVRISRSVIVMYPYVQSFDSDTVYVSTHEGIKGFGITHSYRQKALPLLKKYVQISPAANFEVTQEINGGLSLEGGQDASDEAYSQDSELKENKNSADSVFTFISDHPDCKGSDITDHFHTSLSTVNRILAQLKEEGLIEYVGSKKTGGYRVKS